MRTIRCPRCRKLRPATIGDEATDWFTTRRAKACRKCKDRMKQLGGARDLLHLYAERTEDMLGMNGNR